MTKKPTKHKQPSNPVASDCVVPPAIPVDALSGLVFERDEKSAEEIAAYVERQVAWREMGMNNQRSARMTSEHAASLVTIGNST
jgi:hypothetical protein